MCDACEPFFHPIAVKNSIVLRALLERARSAVDDELLECLESEPAIIDPNAMKSCKQTYTCLRCGQLFILEVGGCHVLGDQWRPLHGN